MRLQLDSNCVDVQDHAGVTAPANQHSLSTPAVVFICLLAVTHVFAETLCQGKKHVAGTTASDAAPDRHRTARRGSPGPPIFPSCRRNHNPFEPGVIHSYYVPMRDGIRIAVDVILPDGTPAETFPAALEMTRYWRSAEGDSLTNQEKTLASHGYAVVTGDVRGTGASFGIWPYHRSRPETLDFGELITWISKQSWSNGKVVGYGVSYSANTADWMPERENPALKAIAPRFPDYDPYADLYFPGGVPNRWMAETWGLAVKEMDLNQRRSPDGKALPGVRPVNSDGDKRLLNQAIEERRNVPSVWQGLKQVTFRDDQPTTWGGASMDNWGIYSVREKVDRSQTPIQTWGSWFDAGTANGVLHRFMTQTNPQRAFIGAWTHGGFRGASPYAQRGASADPPFPAQVADDLCFFDRFVGTNGVEPLQPRKLLAYYILGAERWKTTTVWPLPQARSQTWYFGAHNILEPQKPNGDHGVDKYQVDFSATTGATNRWHTNGGVEEVWYGDRALEDRKLLTYTSQPLRQETEITGQPLADVYIASDRTDGAFILYLEDVGPDGVVRYITEGELRGIDRKVVSAKPLYDVVGPYHSFRREDKLPLKPGEIAELNFSMMPVSVLIRAGHRIRIALAGADADTFERIPETGDALYIVHHDRLHPSHLVLPVVPTSMETHDNFKTAVWQ